MAYDGVPATIASAVLAVTPALPGPTRNEWAVALGGLVALVVRELAWWLRNRR